MSLKNKNNGTTIFFIFLASIILAILLARIGGTVHKYFWGPTPCSLFLIPCDTNMLTEGFIYFYTFFISVFSFAFLNTKLAIKVYVFGTILTWFFTFMALSNVVTAERKEYITTLIVMGILSILGYFIALEVNNVVGYFKNKSRS